MEGQSVNLKDRTHIGRTGCILEGQDAYWKDRVLIGRTVSFPSIKHPVHLIAGWTGCLLDIQGAYCKDRALIGKGRLLKERG